MLSKVSDSAKMESASAKIEMLRGEENWLQWRFVMRTLLKEDDDLINVCEGNLCHLYVAKKLPVDFNEAMRSEKRELWEKAMNDEMKSHYENKTWILVEKPRDQKILSNRWVLTVKLNPDNSERYKARLVIKGCSQKEGIDYKETYSPVARFDTIRLMLSIAAKNNLQLGQFDIKTAFLYGSLKEDIYMKQPQGYEDGTNRVCKLLKSLYGLKQSPRCWTERFTKFISNLKFYQSNADPCFYFYTEDDKLMLMTIYVDDGLVVASDESLIDKFFSDLNREFKITSSKEVKSFLGLEINRLQDGSIFIHQSRYIERMLEKFNMNGANSVSTPIETNWSESIIDNNECNAPYREAVGNLMFLQTGPQTWDSYIQKQAISKPSVMLTMQATKKQESRYQALYVSMRMRPSHGNVSDNNV